MPLSVRRNQPSMAAALHDADPAPRRARGASRPSVGVSLLLLFFPLFAATSFAAAADPIGFVAALQGRVDLLRADESTWTAAVVDENILAGDTLRTGLNSAVKIVLVDDTVLGLGEDTELAIDNLVIGPAALVEPSVLRHLRGQVRTRVGEAFGGTTRVEIHTPTAIMGVKGTEGTTRVDGGVRAQDPWALDGAAAEAEEEEPSTLVRNWEGGITAAMLNGVHLSVPPGKCRIVYRDRIGRPEDCPDDFVPVQVPAEAGGDLAQLQSDLLAGATPPVSAGPESGGIGDIVGEALLIEPPDPVLEDRTDSDAFAGIGINPLANLDFGSGQVEPDPGSNPLDGLDFGTGETGPDPGFDPLDGLDFGAGETGPDPGFDPLGDLDLGSGEVGTDTP